MLTPLQKTLSKGQALLLTSAPNVRWLGNFGGSNGQMVITKTKAYLLTDPRYKEVAKKCVPKNVTTIIYQRGLLQELQKLTKKHSVTNMLFEPGHLTYAEHSAIKKVFSQKKGRKVLLTPSPETSNFRMVKTPEELRLITKAQRIAEKTFQKVVKKLKVGKTEQQVAWEIETIGRKLGADGTSFESIVGFGENSGSPHHQNSSRKLKKGDMVLIDMGMKYRGYCSDMTRTFFTKKPTPLQKKIYETVLKAQEAAIHALKANVKGDAIDKIARDIITKAGYGKTFGHSLGHGIGLEVHESPNLSTGYVGPIPQGTIVTVEPGIYLEKSGGVRIEDMVLIKRDKCVNLTRIPKNIEEVIFPVS